MNHLLPSSITGRLIWLYALTSFCILLTSGVFLIRMLEGHLAAERRQFLSDEVVTLQAIQDEHPDSLDALREEIEFESDADHNAHYQARILEAGRVLVESTGMTALLPPDVFAATLRDPGPADAKPYTLRDGRVYLLLTAVMHLGARPDVARVAQLAVDTSNAATLIANYREDVALVIVIGTLVSTLAGWLMARRGLRPLREVAQHARRITASQLHERVSSAKWPAELTILAAALDEMLERLEQSFRRLSQFSDDLAHELRTPINNLM
ncbi:MAG: hypothetical protein RL033_5569, partial [Pseudomonadota bacterium]